MYQMILLWVCVCVLACGTGSSGTVSSSDEGAVSEGAPSGKKTTYKRESGTAGEIYIAVDETFQPIIETEIETFMGQYPDAVIHALYMPGEEAISRMLEEDSIRMVVSTRELTSIEKAYLKEQQTSDKTTKLATDAVAMIVHKSNTDTIFTQEQITGILSGEITSWKQINPDSPLGQIRIVFDHAQSSTVQFLRDSVLAKAGKELTTQNVFAAKTNKQVLSYVTKDKNALGVLGVAWISDLDDRQMAIFRKDSINVLKLENVRPCSYGDGFYQPYQAYIHQRCYPYTRGVYAILRESFFGLGHGFVAFMASDPGQRIVQKAGLVPDMGFTRVVRLPSKKEREAAENK